MTTLAKVQNVQKNHYLHVDPCPRLHTERSCASQDNIHMALDYGLFMPVYNRLLIFLFDFFA